MWPRRASTGPSPSRPATLRHRMRFPVPADYFPKTIELLRFLPEIILTVTGTLLMVVEPIAGPRWSKIYGHIAILGFAAAMAAAVSAYSMPGPAFSSMLIADGFAAFFRVLVIA